MAVKKKGSFGSVSIDHFSPEPTTDWPKGINVVLSFEEALKLHLGLGQILGHLNAYNRNYKEGRDAAVNLCVFTDVRQVTITEDKVRREKGV